MNEQREVCWRWTSSGREPVAAAGSHKEHVHYSSSGRVGIGSITSRRTTADDITFWDIVAWNLSGAGGTKPVIVAGCTAAKAEELHQKGLVK